MKDRHPLDQLGAYADGELSPEETARVAQHLADCTECGRELALVRSLGGAMRGMVSDTEPRGIWAGIHSKISQPIGWILFVSGVAVWIVMAVWRWFEAEDLSWEWLSATAIWIGLALVAVGVGYEQVRDWKETRYKDLER